jgi:hypothetical protein
MSSPSDISALLDTLVVAPCLCGRAHIVQTEGVQSTVYFAWRNYISDRASAADTGSSASEHVKAIGKSGCTLTPGELSRRMKQGTTQEQVLQWIQHVAGITDRDVLIQFYDLFTAARRPSLHTQDASVGRKRKHAVPQLPASDAGSSRSGAQAPEASESASQPAVLQCGPCTSLTHTGLTHLTPCLVCHERSGSEESEDCRFQHVRDCNTGVIRDRELQRMRESELQLEVQRLVARNRELELQQLKLQQLIAHNRELESLRQLHSREVELQRMRESRLQLEVQRLVERNREVELQLKVHKLAHATLRVAEAEGAQWCAPRLLVCAGMPPSFTRSAGTAVGACAFLLSSDCSLSEWAGPRTRHHDRAYRETVM